MNLQQAKKIPIMYFFKDILGLKGKMSGDNILYSSPFRDDKSPSYSVSITKNISYDFATGQTRDIVSCIADYYKISTSDALKKLEKLTSHTPPKDVKRYIPKEIIKRKFVKENKEKEVLLAKNEAKSEKIALRTQIIEIKEIFYFPLKNYIEKVRKINLETAQIYLKEVHFHLKNKKTLYFGLIWQNISKGYEVASQGGGKKSFKTSIGVKYFSLIEGIEKNANTVLIFEGMFDFLSYLEYEKRKYLKEDVIILNSISCQKKACEYIKNQRKYKEIYLFLDNDEEGKKTAEKIKQNLNIKSLSPRKSIDKIFKISDINEKILGISIFDKSALYKDFKDVNEWWINICKI